MDKFQIHTRQILDADTGKFRPSSHHLDQLGNTLSESNTNHIISSKTNLSRDSAASSFSFKAENLSQKLEQESKLTFTGYWHHQLHHSSQDQILRFWYLGLLEGNAIFSGSQPLSASRLLATLERYLPRLRSDKAKQLLESLRHKFALQDDEHQLSILPTLLKDCYKLTLFRPEEIRYALRLKILQDLDEILFNYAGHAEFLPVSDFSTQALTVGFDLKELLFEAHKRRLIWDKVKTLIPSSDSILTIDHEAIQKAHLESHQKHQLQALLSHGETLNAISTALARDTLEIAKGLAQLVNKGLLTTQAAMKHCEPEIFIVDDSPLMLQQFRMLVTSWGYKVRSCADPTSAITVMKRSNPIVIFIDINMPGLSGFDLLKQIRRQPKLANIPLIVLTSERTLSNNWRAQQSGCKFLSKPLSPEDIPVFKRKLRLLLETTIS